MKLTNEAQSRHQAKSNAVKSQKWECGEVYNDRRSKSRAKILVLDELERRSGKQLVKADKEWGIRWRMDKKLRNAALALCAT